MIKLFIADDNPIVLKALCKSIHWENYGITLISKASNGLDALQQIKDTQPDIIITDIKMPGLSGIELIEAIKAEKIDSNIIIISAYQDFKYAKKALSLGVKEYVVKPIDNIQLVRATLNIKEKIEKEKESKSINSNTEAALQILNQNNVINEILLNNKTINQNKLPYQFYSIFCVKKREKESLFNFIQNLNLETRKQIVYTIYKTYPIAIVMSNNQNGVENIINKLEEKFEDKAVSTECKDLNDSLIYSANQAISIIERRILLKSFKLPLNENEIKKDHITAIEIRENLSTLSKNLANSSLENIEAIIKELINLLYNESLSNNTSVEESINLFMSFFLKDIGENITLKKENYHAFQNINKATSLNDKISEFILFVKTIISEKDRQRNYSRNVLFALKFIEDNINIPITLSDVAHYCRISPAYLSSLIKKETGTNFVDLINKKKINKSIELMQNTTMNMEEISRQCGFSDYAYFFQVFKKYMGKSPKAYANIKND
ncbi:MAG: response regulator [Sphaerochaetaceae bacterium]|nr:response regulator [Sphaerochaetaceae bacterium]